MHSADCKVLSLMNLAGAAVHVLSEPLLRFAPADSAPEQWADSHIDAQSLWPGVEVTTRYSE